MIILTRLLICKDKEQNTLLEAKLLTETENITYSIVDNPPEIKEINGYSGRYTIDEAGNIVVSYEEILKTEFELLKEELEEEKLKNKQLNEAVTELRMIVSMQLT